MKPLLTILMIMFIVKNAYTEKNQPPNNDDDVMLPASPPPKVFSRYQNDFAFHHDRGFYFTTSLGPQWNQSLNKPKAKGVRIGGKINAGYFIADGFCLFGSVWGSFLESASVIATGPGIGILFDSTNIGIDFSLGVGRVFNVIENTNIPNFAESVLAAHLAIGKFWWLSKNSSLGLTLGSGLHGLSLFEGKLNSIGWNLGLQLAYLFG